MGHKTLWTAALALGFAAGLAAAQDKGKTITAVGAVTKISDTTLAVETGKGGTLELMTTDETAISFGSGSGWEREVKLRGEVWNRTKPRVKITDAVHQGDLVQVKYTDVGSKLMASEVQVLQRRPSANPVQ